MAFFFLPLLWAIHWNERRGCYDDCGDDDDDDDGGGGGGGGGDDYDDVDDDGDVVSFWRNDTFCTALSNKTLEK